MSWKIHVVTIGIVTALVFFTNLGGPRLWDRDEPRNAGCASEMLECGDWVTPVFNGELRSHKPVMLYWLMMSAYAVLGVNEFSARFWSAFLAVGVCLCTYTMGRRLFSGRVGLWASVILATTLMFDVAARAATPDSTLIFFCTLALTWYVVRVMPQAPESGHPPSPDAYLPQSWSSAAVMYGIMGLAVLTKGPVGVIVPTAVIGLFLLIRRRSTYGPVKGLGHLLRPFTYFLTTCWRMRIVTATLVVLAVALPWYVWVGVRTDGAWLQGFFLEHNLGRAMNAMEGHGGNSLLFYPMAILLGFAPWSIFALPMAIDLWKRLRRKDSEADGLLFSFCWVIAYVGIFSVARTKLPSYITPCYPGLALLFGSYIDRWSREASLERPLYSRFALALWAVVGVALTVGLPIATTRYLPGIRGIGLVGLIPIVAAAIALTCLRLQRTDAAARAFAMGAFLFVWISFSFVSLKIDSQRTFDDLLADLRGRSVQPQLTFFQILEPSWVFYHGDSIRPVHIGRQGDGGDQSGRIPVRHASQNASDYLTESPDHYILTTRQQFERIRHNLPNTMGVVAETSYFLKDHSIVAIGQTSPMIASREKDTVTQ